jgi:hypothetical protein
MTARTHVHPAASCREACRLLDSGAIWRIVAGEGERGATTCRGAGNVCDMWAILRRERRDPARWARLEVRMPLRATDGLHCWLDAETGEVRP